VRQKIYLKMANEEKKGKKVAKVAHKFLGKKGSKEGITEEIKDALDTDRDGDVDLDDFKEGNWKKINWVKLAFWASVGAAMLYYVYIKLV
jgi:hypothetical protein